MSISFDAILNYPTSIPSIPNSPRASEICPRRLIDAENLRLVSFNEGETVPPYAILSHSQRADRYEVSYRQLLDLEKPKRSLRIFGRQRERTPDVSQVHKARGLGFEKIRNAASMTVKLGFQYLWIDTCCVDGANSIESAECVKFRYAYYRNSAVCMVYLWDVIPPKPDPDFPDANRWTGIPESCVWFGERCMLLELLAPREELFFNSQWNFLGNRSSMRLRDSLRRGTRVPVKILESTLPVENYTLDARLRWIYGRETIYSQEIIYSFMGLLGVQLEPDYDEPVWKTWIKLQQEIVRIHSTLSPSKSYELLSECFGPIPPISWPLHQSEVLPRRFIDTSTLQVVDWSKSDSIPPYAILSFLWDDTKPDSKSWRHRK